MSLAGQWAVTMPTPLGTMRFNWDFTNQGGQWAGKMIGQPPVANSELHSINLAADAVTFQTTTPSPMGALDLTFSGTVTADAIKGTCKTRFGDNPFTAERA